MSTSGKPFILMNEQTGKSVALDEFLIDAIYDAMGDYADHGQEEEDQCIWVREAIHSICS